ncbi:MAG TPA: hypothetical protein VFF06_36885 [Polyangia bacterium]|nr:hypothetical protein [Polyangia bacterium]
MKRLVLVLAITGCAHANPARTLPQTPLVELQLDDGRASERPLTPNQTFEVLMRFEPGLAEWNVKRLRFLLAQPGRIAFTLYAEGPDGRPGRALASFQHDYDGALVSTGKDGRWVVEELDVPEGRGPLWIGYWSASGDARLWASSNATGAVFQRDADPQTPLASTRIPRTPMLRVEVAPWRPSS